MGHIGHGFDLASILGQLRTLSKRERNMTPFGLHEWECTLRRVRRTKAHCLAPLAVLLVVGCAPLTDQFDSEAAPRHVFAVGFENLSDRYIDPVKTGDITLAGLSALSSVDETIEVSRAGDKIRLRVNDVLAAEHPAPHDLDAYGWAWLAADIIKDARRKSPLLRAASNEKLYAAVFDSALSGLDRYSRYTGPTEARHNRASRDGFGGLGITIEVENGITVITEIHENTPAQRAGLLNNDRITHIDGVPIYELSQRKIVDRLRGPVDRAVRVTVSRGPEGNSIEIVVIRAHIIPPTVTARRRGDLLHVRITSFNQGTAASVKRELKRVENEFGTVIKGVILDLRGNPGGLLDQAVEVADLFLSEGRIISTKGRHAESNQIFDAGSSVSAAGIPVAVLINGKSASAAEILAVALRDQGRAVLLGSSSFGKGTVQTIIRLPNSGELILTWARLHAPSGQTLNKRAIVPAFCTNGSDSTTRGVLDVLRSAARANAALPASGMRALNTGPHFTVEAHSACPPNAEQPGSDLEAARLLLKNRNVYHQARLKKPHSTAQR